MLGRLRTAMEALRVAGRLEEASLGASGHGAVLDDRMGAGAPVRQPPPVPAAPAATGRSGIGPWEPMWLGEPSRHLYGSLHRAQGPRANVGVVFVPPLFHELPRSRRMLAEAATGFAGMGMPTLRFDFFGTGDSGGGGEQADFTSMCADIDLAVRVLRSKTGVADVALVAWRGGALPAARWIDEGGAPSTVLLWEPLFDGAAWMQALRQADLEERRLRRQYLRGVPENPVDPDDGQLMGVPVSARLRHDIETASFDPARWSGRDVVRAPRCWAVLRPGAPAPVELQRRFDLPEGAPQFEGRARMDMGLFVTPPVKQVLDTVARALSGAA